MFTRIQVWTHFKAQGTTCLCLALDTSCAKLVLAHTRLNKLQGTAENLHAPCMSNGLSTNVHAHNWLDTLEAIQKDDLVGFARATLSQQDNRGHIRLETLRSTKKSGLEPCWSNVLSLSWFWNMVWCTYKSGYASRHKAKPFGALLEHYPIGNKSMHIEEWMPYQRKHKPHHLIQTHNASGYLVPYVKILKKFKNEHTIHA